ncbi:hypothetical protein NW759_016732 [Fusarium solani]|nr:hypothetical protein NW759_016732 [Fusarium solani]
MWYPHPPVMDPTASLTSAPSSFAKDVDAFSLTEDPPSSSASPNSHQTQISWIEGIAPGTTLPSATIETRVTTPSVPAACLACRRKHLKCDGQNPCSRCRSSSSECVYVASRRGYKGPRRGTAQYPSKRHASSPRYSTSSAPMTSSMTSAFNPRIALPDNGPNSPFVSSITAPNSENNPQLCRSYCSANGIGNNQNLALNHAHRNGAVPAQVPVPTPAERCIDSFYHHFHAAHPFILPNQYLLRTAEEGTIEPLLAAIR